MPAMDITAECIDSAGIASMREQFRAEMNCQIIHDSLHARPGWTQSYRLATDGETAGYGAVAIGGPWQNRPTIFEFFLTPEHRRQTFDLFAALLDATRAVGIETQTNDALLTIMLHAFARGIVSESILFEDGVTTAMSLPGAVLRPTMAGDAEAMTAAALDPQASHMLEFDGAIAGAGGILTHYNPPYGDLYMKVAERFRERGIGSFLVQELKRTARGQGLVPAARCRTENIASRRTLQKAGFVPCGHLLVGAIAR